MAMDDGGLPAIHANDSADQTRGEAVRLWSPLLVNVIVSRQGFSETIGRQSQRTLPGR